MYTDPATVVASVTFPLAAAVRVVTPLPSHALHSAEESAIQTYLAALNGESQRMNDERRSHILRLCTLIQNGGRAR